MALYDTPKKREKFVRTPGSIVTFKAPLRGRTQFLVRKVITNSGYYMIEASGPVDTPWFPSMEKMIEAMDWDFMEDAHRF